MKELSGRAVAPISEGRSLTANRVDSQKITACSIACFSFTDIARPPVVGQRRKAGVINAADLSAVVSIRSLNEVVDQQGQVLDTFPEWRKMK
jgi:hypothetical protein